MDRKHDYELDIIWTGNLGSGTLDYRAYSRDHVVSIDGKEEIEASSDPKFRGDDSRVNPEELFLASIASCHMLWYLHLASANHITVLEYKDTVTGVMVEDSNNGGRFTEVALNPEIVIAEEDRIEQARALHTEASQRCFIANSINLNPTYGGTVSAG